MQAHRQQLFGIAKSSIAHEELLASSSISVTRLHIIVVRSHMYKVDFTGFTLEQQLILVKRETIGSFCV